MKKIFKSSSIILLGVIPLLSLAQSVPQDNTEQSFNASKDQAKAQALAITPDQKNTKVFKDLLSYGADKLQSRLASILKDKENYPQVADEVSTFKTDIKANISKFKSTDGKLSKAKQISVKNVLSNGIFKTLDQKIAKLESADNKITQKISLLIASNVDASSTASLLADAEQKLAIAKSSVAEIKSQINGAISSQNGVSSDAIKTSVTDANNKILDAVNAYKITLDSIPQSISSNVASSSPSEIESTSTEIDQNQDNTSTTTIETSNSESQVQDN